ncbi:MAG: N-6 DNA methylase, partial [Elusimicrobiota bacterium]|nr:N-6 DNA methylase [Elusimicrobiota bacterium]
CYGIFAAKLNDAENPESGQKFNRQRAADLIPKSNPFLRKFFKYISEDLEEGIKWLIDDLISLFNAADIGEILKEFHAAQSDPYIHFYETFLSQYNPSLRKTRGVYYTPAPAVHFIVKAIDGILKTDFSLQKGLADNSKVKRIIETREESELTQEQSAKIQQERKLKDKIDFKIKTKEIEFHRVQILDPAAGTGAFLAEIIDKIYGKFQKQKGKWTDYAREHLLPRLNGFEILMASYSMAHFKLDMKLKETGFHFNQQERLRIYLTNSLETPKKNTQDYPFAFWLSDEGAEANKIKKDTPVMVIVGNPPYSGESSNKTDAHFLDEYKKEPSGVKLKEKNSKGINDDYVKFIRLGQDFIDKNNCGILAFINNHAFLDNPTFRGMRYSLLKSFDKIYVLNLHGNSKRKERSPDGSADENIFDIQQGVSINIFIKELKVESEKLKVEENNILEMAKDGGDGNNAKTPGVIAAEAAIPVYPNNTRELKVESEKLKIEENNILETAKGNGNGVNAKTPGALAKVYYSDLYGSRKSKMNFLQNQEIDKIKWTQIENKEPYFFFVPKDFSLSDEYNENFSIAELFILNSVGIATGRDDLAIQFSKEEMIETIKDFGNLDAEEIRAKYNLGKDVRDWSAAGAQRDLKTSGFDENKITKICYRPFDIRWTYYTGNSKGFHCIGRDRFKTMKNYLKGDNIGLLAERIMGNKDMPYKDVFITNKISDKHFLGGGCYTFPLYIYDENNERIPNLKSEIISKIESGLNLTFDAGIGGDIFQSSATGKTKTAAAEVFYPTDLLDYIYAILHSPNYRQKYRAFLKTDFPRIPYPKGIQTFRSLCALGARLRKCHLLLEIEPSESLAAFPIPGDALVDRCEMLAGNVYINKEQYFENVPSAVWNFYIGNYQPAQKYLKDRKGRILSFEEIENYQKIIISLQKTDDLMKEIDKASGIKN